MLPFASCLLCLAVAAENGEHQQVNSSDTSDSDCGKSLGELMAEARTLFGEVVAAQRRLEKKRKRELEIARGAADSASSSQRHTGSDLPQAPPASSSSAMHAMPRTPPPEQEESEEAEAEEEEEEEEPEEAIQSRLAADAEGQSASKATETKQASSITSQASSTSRAA